MNAATRTQITTAYNEVAAFVNITPTTAALVALLCTVDRLETEAVGRRVQVRVDGSIVRGRIVSCTFDHLRATARVVLPVFRMELDNGREVRLTDI